jgi:hypothetical protein
VPVNLENGATEPAEIESRLAGYEAAGVQLWPVIDLPRQGAVAAARWRAALTQWLGRGVLQIHRHSHRNRDCRLAECGGEPGHDCRIARVLNRNSRHPTFSRKSGARENQHERGNLRGHREPARSATA